VQCLKTNLSRYALKAEELYHRIDAARAVYGDHIGWIRDLGVSD